MALAKPIGEYESVRAWFESLREQWGEEPDDWDEKTRALDAFCSFVDKEPDTIIAECIRESESVRKISVKGRRFYNDKIAEWQDQLAGERREQARAGNTVRSFLIHNGIFLQSGMQT
ncbi:MAG: hypothetical protein WD379_09355 [Dehalococcoidia bacterium]